MPTQPSILTYTPILWPGSGSSPVGKTPMGYYDNDAQFVRDAPKIANWCARSLGYPVMDVELEEYGFYSAFEEAISEYSAHVNEFTIRENMFSLMGSEVTDQYKKDLNSRPLEPTINRIIEISNKYGFETNVGEGVNIRQGYITVAAGQQIYDINALWADVSESGNRLEIRRIYHTEPVAFSYGVAGVYNAPGVLGSAGGAATVGTLSEFGWDGMAAGGMTATGLGYTVMPIYEDLLRMQAVEFNMQIRRSGYSFELNNNILKIFPIPFTSTRIYFDYILKSDRSHIGPLPTHAIGNHNDMHNSGSWTTGSNAGYIPGEGATPTGSYSVSNLADAPYDIIPYSRINEPGRRWIRRFTLCRSKEMLGEVRQKYSTIPIPNSEITLNGDALKSEAQQEKQELVTQLRESLEKASTTSQLDMQRQNTENTQTVLKNVPMKIYVG
jgi:hypothetical protein